MTLDEASMKFKELVDLIDDQLIIMVNMGMIFLEGRNSIYLMKFTN